MKPAYTSHRALRKSPAKLALAMSAVSSDKDPVSTYFFSGYARLPQDVSHQPVYQRVGVVMEIDQHGVIVACSSTLTTDLARDFLARLVVGHSALHERELIQAALRRHYRGHSQSALISALHKVFEGVDQSPIVRGE